MLHKIRWTATKIAQRIELIEPLVYRRQHPLAPFRYTTLPEPLADPPMGDNVDDGDWPVIEPNTYWGTWMTDYALRTSFQAPADWDPDAPVALYLPMGEAGDFSHPESLAYVDGEPYAACDRHHQEILLPEKWRDGTTHLLALHTWTGLGGWRFGEPGTKLFMNPCAVVQIDQPTRDFIATARVALGIARSLDANEPAKGHLLNALDEAFKILDIREPFGDEFYASIAPAHAALRAGIEKAGAPLDVDIVGTGHAHIDVAWLWTLGQTRRKSGRTFHTVLRLMEQFPEYQFNQSQPQLYDYLKGDYPDLLDAIKERVAEGRWEPLGGMWVEADCNLTGSESLARQFLLGRTFFRDHFGPDVDSPVLWLPDVFGYAWALPQLIKQAGLEYFMTIKIGWNQYNRLPYDSFWWQGLDGTKVLTHFSTTPNIGGGHGVSTYNAMATPEQAIGTWTNFQQKELQQELLMIYGYGDGGGGPTREMLENIREMAAFPATPRMRQDSVGNFFHNLETTSGEVLPTWNAELYFELHRGTYTTQSRNKRANRKSEFLLHDAEFLAALAAMLDAGYSYPATTLNEAWKLVCLNQFHDIIPGSSINPVYVESLQQYAEIADMGADVRDAALDTIAEKLGSEFILVNPTSFAQNDPAFWPGQLPAGIHLQEADGTPVPTQSTSDGTWITAGNLAPFGVTPLLTAAGEVPTLDTGLTATSTLLENQYLRAELDEAGDIVRIFDKINGREVLPPESVANQFQALEDRPMNWDAWDVDIFIDDKMWAADPATSVQVVETGPLRATLEIRRRVLHSDYVQRISLAYNSARLDFDTTIDWQERHIMLKVAFPVDVLTPVATYEIQWGNVERPTHRNTSWDWARFETCAQKWVDLSEGGYGVSLLNDCKYGHDVKDNVMRISLLRGATSPDPEADQGEHRFAYSLLPHDGGWNETTIAAAYALNDPLIVWQNRSQSHNSNSQSPVSACFVSVDQSNIVVETIKQAEQGNDIIVRLYESHRRRGAVTLTTGFDLAEVWHTNLLEENQAALSPDGNSVTLLVKPYEIVTLRLVPA
ncbi:MAG: alpha-mannosidase [Chloroflexi bacterium]|nr:alpha-mannosidase [Chloroflexota bacterium]